MSAVPRRIARIVEIRGRVARTYRVRDIAEVDAHLRGLRTWLADAIGRAPALTRRHIEFYAADVDALLDQRSKLMRAQAEVEPGVEVSAQTLQAGTITVETLAANRVWGPK